MRGWVLIRSDCVCVPQQLEGVESRSYPDYKLKEFRERVELLEKEHKRWRVEIFKHRICFNEYKNIIIFVSS